MELTIFSPSSKKSTHPIETTMLIPIFASAKSPFRFIFKPTFIINEKIPSVGGIFLFYMGVVDDRAN